MPLGRLKDHIWMTGPGSGGEPWVYRYPSWPIVSGTFAIQWLLYRPPSSALPVAAETIELCGDGSTRGYRLEYLPTGAFRFTVYSAGPTAVAVTTANNIAAETGVFCYVGAWRLGSNSRIQLNDTVGALTAASMAATIANDHRLMGAEALVFPSAPLMGLFMAATTFSYGVDQNPYPTTRYAQRLAQARNMVSYIDFGRLGGNPFTATSPHGHVGDDVNGARVEVPSTGGGIVGYRSDRDQDWSTA